MIRTQIQFTQSQMAALRDLSAATGRSIADLTRDAVAAYLELKGRPSRSVAVEQAISIAGQFGSGTGNASSDHDRYLAESFGA